MKKIALLLLIAFTAASCKKEAPNYVTYAGTIENIAETDSILSISNRTFKKDIHIAKDGSFSDTLNIKEAGYYSVLINGRNAGFVFLRNGFDLNLTADKNKFFETSKYSGEGASSSNYLLAQYKIGRTFGDARSSFVLEKDAFTKKINGFKSKFDSLKKQYKDLDTMLVRTNDKQNNDFFTSLEKNYEVQHARAKLQQEAALKLAKGKPSPTFKNYLNYKGGKTSLSAFKGKYVYIDVWATWCKPCIAQIPALKKLEKQYHNKNIEFVSISIDDESTAGSWDNAKSKWKKMVKDMSLTGVQLYAGKDIQFMKDYQVSGIPRFMLIDPKGNIVNANAPRPTDPALINLFNQLKL